MPDFPRRQLSYVWSSNFSSPLFSKTIFDLSWRLRHRPYSLRKSFGGREVSRATRKLRAGPGPARAQQPAIFGAQPPRSLSARERTGATRAATVLSAGRALRAGDARRPTHPAAQHDVGSLRAVPGRRAKRNRSARSRKAQHDLPRNTPRSSREAQPIGPVAQGAT